MQPNRKTLVPMLLVVISSLATLLAANFLFVHFSPLMANQSIFPRALINSLDGCYQTFYPSTHDKILKDWTAVIGDSYGAGEGDEFLGGADDYGLVHKLRQRDHGNYLVFARGGFGSINATREMTQCLTFMNGSALFSAIEAPRKIIVLFYEGNDLNDNINHLSTMAADAGVDNFVSDQIVAGLDTRRQFALYFPLLGLVADGGRSVARGILAPARAQETTDADHVHKVLSEVPANHVMLDQGRFRVPLDPQSAAMELSVQDLRKALMAFQRSVTMLRERFPAAAIEIAYLPSPVTVYAWTDSIRVQTYHGSDGLITTAADNLHRSARIRQDIEQFSKRHGFAFIDPTPALRRLATLNLLHGPRDWKHFNRLGYQAVAEAIVPVVIAPIVP